MLCSPNENGTSDHASAYGRLCAFSSPRASYVSPALTVRFTCYEPRTWHVVRRSDFHRLPLAADRPAFPQTYLHVRGRTPFRARRLHLPWTSAYRGCGSGRGLVLFRPTPFVRPIVIHSRVRSSQGRFLCAPLGVFSFPRFGRLSQLHFSQLFGPRLEAPARCLFAAVASLTLRVSSRVRLRYPHLGFPLHCFKAEHAALRTCSHLPVPFSASFPLVEHLCK